MIKYFTSVLAITLLSISYTSPVYAVPQEELPVSEVSRDEDNRISRLGVRYRSQGLYKKAEPLLKRVIAIRVADVKQWPTDESIRKRLSTAQHNLAVLKFEQEKLEQAERLFKRVLSKKYKSYSLLGPSIDINRETHRMLAILNRHRGNYEESVRFFNLALKGLDPWDLEEMSLVKSGIIKTYKLWGKESKLAVKNTESALVNLKSGIATAEKNLGSEHHSLARPLKSLSYIYMDMGKYSLAEPLYKRVLAMEKKKPNSKVDESNVNIIMAHIYFEQAKYEQAEKIYLGYLSLQEKKSRWTREERPIVLIRLGAIYAAQNKVVKAEKYYKRGLAANEKELGIDHPRVASNLDDIAKLYRVMNRGAEADKLASRSQRILKYHE